MANLRSGVLFLEERESIVTQESAGLESLTDRLTAEYLSFLSRSSEKGTPDRRLPFGHSPTPPPFYYFFFFFFGYSCLAQIVLHLAGIMNESVVQLIPVDLWEILAFNTT